jgi:hypothetical protein
MCDPVQKKPEDPISISFAFDLQTNKQANVFVNKETLF